MANRNKRNREEEHSDMIAKLMKDTEELVNNQKRTENRLMLSQTLLNQLLTEVSFFW